MQVCDLKNDLYAQSSSLIACNKTDITEKCTEGKLKGLRSEYA